MAQNPDRLKLQAAAGIESIRDSCACYPAPCAEVIKSRTNSQLAMKSFIPGATKYRNGPDSTSIDRQHANHSMLARVARSDQAA